MSEQQWDLFWDKPATKTRSSEKEWVDMPEFVQNKQKEYAKLIVRFDSEQNLQDFAEKIGQRLNCKSKSIWHPKLVRGLNANKRYVDES